MAVIKIVVLFLLIAAVYSEEIVKNAEQKTDDGTIKTTTEENGFGPTGSEGSTTTSLDKVPEISTATKHQDTLVEAENSISESSSDTTTHPYSTASESQKKSREVTTPLPIPINNKGKVRTITIRKEVRYAIPHPVPIHVEKQVPFPVRIPVEIPVDRPYPVHVVQPYPFAVEKQIPYPVAISSPVAVPVPHPFLIKQLVPIIISDQSSFHDGHYIGDYEDQETVQNEDKFHKGRLETSNYNRYNPSNQGTYVNTIEGQYAGNKNIPFHNNDYQNNAAVVPNKSVGQIGAPSSSGYQTTSLHNNNIYVPSANTNAARDGGNLKPNQATSSFHNQQISVTNSVGDGRSESAFQSSSPRVESAHGRSVSVFQNNSPGLESGPGRSESVFQNNSPLLQRAITSNYLRVTSSSPGNPTQNSFSDGSLSLERHEQQNLGHIGQTPYSNEAASINQGINSFSNQVSARGFSESLVSRTQSSLGRSAQLDDSYVRSNIPQSNFQTSSYGSQKQNPIIISQGNQLSSTNTFDTVIPASNPFGAQRTIGTNQLLATEFTRHRSVNI